MNAAAPLSVRRTTFASRRSSTANVAIVPAVASRILQASVAILVVVWIGTAFRFLVNNEGGIHKNNRLRDISSIAKQNHDGALHLHLENIVALDLELDHGHTITVRISVFPNKCPKAYEFLTWMIENQNTECRPCTLYRGEPTPSYWGSADYPDQWDNGGRWGPPYTLVQGGFSTPASSTST